MWYARRSQNLHFASGQGGFERIFGSVISAVPHALRRRNSYYQRFDGGPV